MAGAFYRALTLCRRYFPSINSCHPYITPLRKESLWPFYGSEKQRRREINFYYVNFYTTFGWPGSNTDLPVSWPNLHAIFFAIPSWLSDFLWHLDFLIRFKSGFHFARQWINPPTTRQFSHASYFQEADYGDVLRYLSSYLAPEGPKLYCGWLFCSRRSKWCT